MASSDPVQRVRSYDPLINEAAKKYGVPANLIRAAMLQESGGNPDAVSNQEAMGLMQVIPATWERMGGGDPKDPATNIDRGVKYLAMQLQEFGTPEAALAAYHQGEGTTRLTRGKPAGPKTRHYVGAVMANMARFNLTEQAQNYEPSGPQPTIATTGRAHLMQQDDRLPIIAEGLRIQGKTLEEFKGRLEDPMYRQKLYLATMAHAQGVDPTLTMARGEDAYMTVLKTIPGPNDAPPKPPAQKGVDVQEVSDRVNEGVKQAVVGGAVDIAEGVVTSAEDMGRIAKKFGDLVQKTTGLNSDAAQIAVHPGLYVTSRVIDAIRERAGSDPSKILSAWAEENVISKPDNIVDGLTRGVAGFLVPYLKMKQMFAGGVKVAQVGSQILKTPVAGKVAQAGASAAVTAFQDPSDPLASEAIENLARGLDPSNPGAIRSWITRYITGELPEDELYKNLANRGLRTGEDTLLGIAAEGVFAGIKQLKNGYEHVFKKTSPAPQAAAQTPPPLSKPMEETFTPPEAPTEQVFPEVPPPIKGSGLEVSLDEGPSAQRVEPKSQLILDLEARQEVIDIESAQTGTPSTFAVDTLHSKQGDLVIERLNANPENPAHQKAAQDWLQSTRQTTSADVSRMREEVALRLSEVPETGISFEIPPPKIATTVEDVQDKILNDVFNNPDMGAQTLSENRDAVVKDLTQAGMRPAEAQEYINRTLSLFAPPNVRDIQAASRTVENPPKGPTGILLQSLKDQGLEKEALKAITLAGLKGVTAATVAAELVLPGESEAADESGMSANEKIFAAGIVAALGGTVALKKAGFIGKGMKKIVSMSDNVVSKTADVQYKRMTPPPLKPVKPGVSPARIEAVGELSPEDLKSVDKLLEKTNPRLDLIVDTTDLASTREAARILLDDVPNTERLKYLNTPLNSANEIAEEIGADPKQLQELINRTTDPRAFSNDLKSVVYLSLKAKQQLLNLTTAWHGIPQGVDKSELVAKIHRLHGVYTALATGMELTGSDSARALNVLRQASDGRLLTLAYEGVNAGDLIQNPETLQRYMGQLLNLLEQPGGKAAEMGRKMIKPTFAGAMSQAFIHTLLGAMQTVANTAWSGGYRIALSPFIRLGGAVAQKYGPDRLTGIYKAGESPEVEEFGAMIGAIAKYFSRSVKAAAKTAITGETTFLEHGASIGAANQYPNVFVREAFGPIPKVMDQAGALVGLPTAGNFFNHLGSFLEVIGTRGLVTVDEFTQAMVEGMELEAHAIRASKNPALALNTSADLHKFIEDFVQNPPDSTVQEIKYMKSSASYMNKMFDPRAGGSVGMLEMRKLAGHFENSVKRFPASRVLFPFVRTAMNVGQFTAEMTPGLNVAVMWSDLKSPNPWVRGEAQGRFIASMGLAAAFTMWGAQGNVRGVLTDDPTYRAELEKAGVPENSVDWGGRTWKINTREPLGFLLAAFGQLGAVMSGESIAEEEMYAVESLWHSVFNLLKDHHFAGAVAELMHDMDPRELDNRLKRLGLAGAAMETIDDILLRPMLPPRQWQELMTATDNTRKVYDTYWEKLKARTFPSGAKTETDIMRRPRWAGSGLSNDSINNAVKTVTGVNQDRIKQDPLSVKLIAKSIHIPDPRPNVEVGGVVVPLTKAEQQELRWTIGHPPGAPLSLYQALTQLTNHPRWNSLSNAQAEDAVKDIVQKYTTVARQFLIARSPEIQQRLRDMKKQKGL